MIVSFGLQQSAQQLTAPVVVYPSQGVASAPAAPNRVKNSLMLAQHRMMGR